ncbi:amino acid deaminase [Vibrio navarrensis]|uniref:amino acid deaminase n=1 Tax=Vibrio navarrensis TaxID=29495 RepID=UPI00192F55AC|nr:amino acid deaminase [Vibrio navarrensis]MBE3669188.1 amino acid deaminase [Vibrio navarrensis]
MSKIKDLSDKNYQTHADNFPAEGEKGQALHTHLPSLAHDEISLPAAVLNHSALENNLRWMQDFADRHQVKLAPHGKTSMTPELFRQQLQHGAWGITVASPAQAQVAVMAGAKRVIMANQLVGKGNMAIIAKLLSEQSIEFYCCVDSTRNVDALAEFFAAQQLTLNVLIEYGVAGGRCGCRTPQQVHALATHIARQPNLKLAGIEVYEGVIHGDNAESEIRTFIHTACELTRQLQTAGLLPAKPLLTGAGSAWYDVVAKTFAEQGGIETVIRPGCYVTHDTGIYQMAQQQVMARAKQHQGAACELNGDLISALEIWAHVISRPEPTRLLVGMGKRDVAFDAGLPTLQLAFRDGEPLALPQHSQAVAIMDQHTFVEIPADCSLDVGDILVFSTSHPCLTFDKWRALALRDEQYHVTQWLETRF